MCSDDFSTVFNRYKSLVFSIAYNYCKNVADANDITQEGYPVWILRLIRQYGGI